MNVYKTLLAAIPFLLVFFYIVDRQSAFDEEMARDDAKFERDWNQFEADFPLNSRDTQQVHAERAAEADQRLKQLQAEAEQQKQEKQRKREEMDRQLKAAMDKLLEE